MKEKPSNQKSIQPQAVTNLHYYIPDEVLPVRKTSKHLRIKCHVKQLKKILMRGNAITCGHLCQAQAINYIIDLALVKKYGTENLQIFPLRDYPRSLDLTCMANKEMALNRN